MRFAKMHGLGNNYIYVNLWEECVSEEELVPLAVQVADVNTGIGSDGLITIGPSQVADARMRIFNADGSEGQNCGNGLRCVGKYLYDKGIVKNSRIVIETGAGLMKLDLHPGADGFVEEVTVDMGEPRLRRVDLPVLTGAPDGTALADTIEAAGRTFTFTGVSMGNPHAVMFVDDAATYDVAGVGPQIERHPAFPERVNVEFVTMKGSREMDFRVWERGSGITQACGTGACAAVVAAILNGRAARAEEVRVHLAGGDLRITLALDGHVYMRGAAAWIMEGVWLNGRVALTA